MIGILDLRHLRPLWVDELEYDYFISAESAVET